MVPARWRVLRIVNGVARGSVAWPSLSAKRSLGLEPARRLLTISFPVPKNRFDQIIRNESMQLTRLFSHGMNTE